MEENGRKPALMSGGDMLAHDLRTVKEHCPFKMQFWVTNTTQFEKKRDEKQVCKGCGSEGESVPCGARRT